METITELLKEPFDVKVVHYRVGATNAKQLGCKPWEATSGIALAYIDARDVMKRLDEVCGDDWQVRYPFKGCCEVGIKIDGEWLWRSNGAGETDVEGEKGMYSDAFKRAAVLWGVGRYLYYLPNNWCDLKNGKIIKPPELPSWAKPSVFRFKAGEKDELIERMLGFLQTADEQGINEVMADYPDMESRMAMWSVFSSRERSSIKSISGENNA